MKEDRKKKKRSSFQNSKSPLACNLFLKRLKLWDYSVRIHSLRITLLWAIPCHLRKVKDLVSILLSPPTFPPGLWLCCLFYQITQANFMRYLITVHCYPQVLFSLWNLKYLRTYRLKILCKSLIPYLYIPWI